MSYVKYNARKIEMDGMLFDSKAEARRYKVLKTMEEAGQISDLETQVKYVLIPAQYGPDKIGPRGGITKGKLLEKECAYVADFRYKNFDGDEIVEDVKGFKTDVYIIKRKLMLYVHGIKVQEV